MADEQETMEARRKKEQRIIDLKWHLQSFDSDVGDYKVVKTYEARLKGEEDPYDTDVLLSERQKVRDEINSLQKELKNDA